MSRVGKKEIVVPDKTEVNISEGLVSVKGPLGELNLAYKPLFNISVTDGILTVVPRKETLESRALWGTYASHITNMISGVNKFFEKKLIIEGVGYKAAVVGDKIVLNIGFSHPVELKIPDGIKCEVEKGIISISGINKEVVGEFAATIRSNKKPEPYKGKGIRYSDEVVRRKEGKKSV